MKTHPKKQNNASSRNAHAGSLMQDSNKKPIKYIVKSPDGLSLTNEPFESLEAAAKYIPTYCRNLEFQGYYAAVGRRISLDELPYWLTFEPVWPDYNEEVESWPAKPF